jgi:aryl-phospho-beta-D-glucosidase BglC (GH1 family)
MIVDASGQPVWLTGANWFGFNAGERVLHGLWSGNLDDIIRMSTERGINLMRVPISTQLLHEWSQGVFTAININTYANPELEGLNSLEVFDAFLGVARKYGMKVLLDVHSAEADNSGHVAPMWYKGSITADMFYDSWVWVAARYKNDDTIVAFDLENEPHGKPWADNPFAKWDGSTDENNWKYVCENAGKKILAVHPNVLILCEGIETYPIDGVSWGGGSANDYYGYWWGGNLRGAADYPVNLGAHQDQLVYSPHDYGPLVYAQPWFYAGFNKQSLYEDVWLDNWLYLHNDNVAPLFIGEWGGFMDGGSNEIWMGAMRDLIIEYKLHHTFWCINPNSSDTGGLLENDWASWDEDKYSAILEPALWKHSSGRYVGLDHAVPLGGSTATGMTVTEYYSSGGPAPVGP